MSRNEALQTEESSGGAGASASASSGAILSVKIGKPREETSSALQDAEPAVHMMTDVDTSRPAMRHSGGAGFDMTPAAASRGSFKAAHRHSARVRLFRRVAIGGSVLAVALISAAVLLNPLRSLPGTLSVSRVEVDGTKITVNSPNISGLQKDGHPFEIKARSGIQDITAPNIIELLGIDSKIGTADASTTWVSAARGVYDSLNDKMSLEGDIRIKNSTGYDIRLKTVRIDFKTGGLVSEGPVKVNLDGGTIAAKQLEVTDNGHKVSFGGEVSSIIDAGAEEAKPGGALTESVR